jgi:uncharacterized protein with ParB-like and HNH nuclease domain
MMEIKPVDLTVKTLLESFFYCVPRFQRPYSWDRENVAEFWSDAIRSEDAEYFIGSFVSYRENQSSDTMQVVDGQQRLTTITLLLAALRNAFEREGHPQLAQGVQQLIERPDINHDQKFVLQSESPYPYLQEHIQKFGPPDLKADLGTEEEAIKSAYQYLTDQVDAMVADVEQDERIPADRKVTYKKRILIELRDKLLQLQLILIQLGSEVDAYIIFETLNTRGKDLRVSDLVKNHLTRLIKPKNKGVDVARQKWSDILGRFDESEADIDINRFIHHSWLSRQPYVPEKKLFKEIKGSVRKTNALAYLQGLEGDSELYRSIVDPSLGKWGKDERPLRKSLDAINLFRIVQPVPTLLAILRAYEDERLSLKQVKAILRSMENFHFQFSAVTAQRTGGGTFQMFALSARELEKADSKNKADQVLKEFTAKLKGRLPTALEFEAGFTQIAQTEEAAKQRPLVRYLLARIDEYLRDDATIDYSQMTIEHVASQNPADGQPLQHVGAVGNLLFLAPKLNDKLKNKPFDKKIAILKKAHFPLDESLREATNWGNTEIITRTRALAKLSQDKVFRV